MPRIHDRQAVTGRGRDPGDFSNTDPVGRLQSRLAVREIAAPRNITASAHRSALIPYVVRTLSEHARGRELSALQQRVAEPLIRAGLGRRILRRYAEFSQGIREAFDNRYFSADTAAEVDRLLTTQIRSAADRIAQDIQARPSDAYTLAGGFNRLVVPAGFAHKAIGFPEGQGAAQGYHFRLEYRGVSIIKGHDRSGGPDPYLMAGFYLQYSPSAALSQLASPFKIKHIPSDLPEHNYPGQWCPRGGDQDADGNPVKPSQIFPKITQAVTVPLPTGGTAQIQVPGSVCSLEAATPLLYPDRRHLALISVWEEDGDQSEQLLNNFGDLALLVAAVLAGIAGLAVPGLALTVIGMVWDFIVGCLASSADDPIADIVLVFDREELEKQYYREIEARVRRPSEEECASSLAQYNAGLQVENLQRRARGLPPLPALTSWPYNDWVLYFGVESKKA